MDRILVLRGGALGDLIVTLPALAALREGWPTSRIELVGNATAGQLAQSAQLIDAGHSQHEARWTELYRAAELSEALGDWLGQFDLVLNFWPDPTRELAKHFPRREGQLFLSAASHPQIAPAAAHYLSPLTALGLQGKCLRFDLSPFFPRAKSRVEYSPSAHVIKEESRLRIALHAGSGSPRKNWPLSRWTEIALWLRHTMEADLVIVSGEAESADVLDGLGIAARGLALDELALVLRGCRLFLGHDSGVSHLAAALGPECILLFGPTDPVMWAPPGTQVKIIQRGEQLEAISVADVERAVRQALLDRR